MILAAAVSRILEVRRIRMNEGHGQVEGSGRVKGSSALA
jgi:hypothetical protein